MDSFISKKEFPAKDGSRRWLVWYFANDLAVLLYFELDPCLNLIIFFFPDL